MHRPHTPEPVRVQLRAESSRDVTYLDDVEVGEIVAIEDGNRKVRVYLNGMRATAVTETYGQAILTAERLLGELIAMQTDDH